MEKGKFCVRNAKGEYLCWNPKRASFCHRSPEKITSGEVQPIIGEAKLMALHMMDGCSMVPASEILKIEGEFFLKGPMPDLRGRR